MHVWNNATGRLSICTHSQRGMLTATRLRRRRSCQQLAYQFNYIVEHYLWIDRYTSVVCNFMQLTCQLVKRRWKRGFSSCLSCSYLSLNLTELSVMGSYWNLMRCKCSTGGNEAKITPFSASWRPCSPASYLFSPSRVSVLM